MGFGSWLALRIFPLRPAARYRVRASPKLRLRGLFGAKFGERKAHALRTTSTRFFMNRYG
jgi:hypothetical protein